MIDIKHLIEYLPFYYKHKDTYKDGNGKGILENFLEICGTYFQDNIKAEIDHSLDILDLDNTSQYYLRFLWDMLGQMPFARTSGQGSLKLTEKQQRDLIKYTNALLKIRGTVEFFQIVFRIFNNSDNNISISITPETPGWEKDRLKNTDIHHPYFDSDPFDDDNVRMDEYYRMKQCLKTTFAITGNIHQEDYQSLIAFIYRFVPYFVKPHILINGNEIEETYTIKLFKYDPLNYRWEEAGDITQIHGDINLRFKVEIYDRFGNAVSKDFKSWIGGNQKTSRISPYTFSVTGMISNRDIYHFKTGGQEIDHTITKIALAAPVYKITTPVVESTNTKITAGTPSVVVKVKATKTFNGVTVPVNVVNKNLREIAVPDGDGYARFTLTEKGTYKFSPSHSYSTESKIIIEQEGVREDAYDIYVRRVMPTPAETFWSKNSSATLSNYSTIDAQFQVKLVFNNLPAGLKYKGAALTADILSLLTEVQAKAGMSAEDFAKVQPIMAKAKATILGIPSISIPSGGYWVVPNTGAYQLLPKYNTQDEVLRAVVSKLKQSVVWDVNVLKDSTEQPTADLEITNDANSVTAYIQIKQTNLPLLGNTAEDNSLRNLDIILPDGRTVTIHHSDISIGDDNYKVEWITKTGTLKVKLTSKIGGIYSFKMQIGESSTAVVHISDYRIPPEQSSDPITGILIMPINHNGWVPATSDNLVGLSRTFQLSGNDTEAKFRILPAYIDSEDNLTIYDRNVEEYGNFETSDGTEEELGVELTLKEKGTYTFKYKLTVGDEDKPATYSEVTLEIKDWQSTIALEVTPSIGTLQNGQSTAILRVFSNKPTDILLIKELVTGDIYKDGDVFTAYSVTPVDKSFTFVPIVNGEIILENPDGESTKKTLKVIDPNDITVEPLILEWDADDLTTKSITITPGNKSTQWIVVTSD